LKLHNKNQRAGGKEKETNPNAKTSGQTPVRDGVTPRWWGTGVPTAGWCHEPRHCIPAGNSTGGFGAEPLPHHCCVLAHSHSCRGGGAAGAVL